ncbi:anhydro-N-acetylmuramic acid kinase [Microbacterium jejuense]|uniref:Anhydro-N-acetylmuramic acid kinase n=1 Tax=Microbacterium jejuense TaxID=1263637 RepID=A0ABS7HPW6_9MICO|nr:anhydro-N-acetylmuramic acid kinase [Microbacterium jejuense]MBW9094286.1 anhydro-N-acetylmuramic acid kinase [Microbacterium jejuense]
MRILALQSGTSADGIDAALVTATPGDDALDLVIERWATEPWLPDERALVMRAVAGAPLHPSEWCRLETVVGQAFARAAVSFLAETPRPDLVCAHGQTVFHGVDDGRVWGTLQVGEPAWIARATGCPVLFNLRVADVAAGGQGAPLISAFDGRWLRSAADEAAAPIASLNLGGIANLQVVRPGGAVAGFDTGPANALLDAYVARETEGAETFDRDGRHAAAGRVDAALLQRLLGHPYFALAAPKSTGRETFTLATVDAALAERTPTVGAGVSSAGARAPFAQRPGGEAAAVERPERDETPRAHAQPVPPASLTLDDVCATLVELTAASVADALHRAAPDAARLIVSGGGARNPVLMARLAALTGMPVESSDAWGIPADAREAVMFAAIAYLSVLRVPLVLPGTPEGRAAVAGQWDLSVAPLPIPPAVTGGASQRLRVRTREERP